MNEPSREETLDVLLVDDSPTYRMILARALKGWPRANVVATAGDGQAALDAIVQKKPHLVLLDVSMPVLDGIETLRRSRQRHDDVDVVMLSGLDESQTGLTMQALSLGALDFVPKPQGDNPTESFTALTTNLYPLLELAWARRRRRFARAEAARQAKSGPRQMLVFGAPSNGPNHSAPPNRSTSTISSPDSQIVPPTEPISRPRPAPPAASPQAPARPAPPAPPKAVPVAKPIGPSTRRPPRNPELVVVGVSTGGPNALHALVPHIPRNFPLPILCVQHMPPLFTRLLAERLTAQFAVPVREGSPGAALRPGQAWIAPGDHHLIVVRDGTQVRLLVHQDPPENSCRPAVDVLLRSVARAFGPNSLTVILTGMGQDGLRGCEAVREAGGQVLAQDEATSVVWGMPGFVVKAGLADRVLPLSMIAGEIVRRVRP